MGSTEGEPGPKEEAKPRLTYSRETLLALRDSPKCRSLPQGLDADDLSDLQESCFFDKSPTVDGPPIYLGPQRGPAGARAPFGAAARRPSAGPPAPIHSRLIEEEERPYQRAASGQLPTAFGGSPSKPQAIQRAASGRYEDPAKMDRWDSRKLGGPSSAEEGGWQQQKARGGGDSWRGGATASPATAAPRGSVDGGRAGSGWGRDSADLARQGSSAPKDGNNNGRWVRDEGDWRARKQSGALPEPRYDWSDSRPAAAPGAPAGRGPPPGFHERDRQPEWADDDAGARPRMTAADIEAERLRMQEQWKKQGGSAASAAQSSMADIMTDDDIMSMMKEEDERQGSRPPAANGGGPAAAAAPPPKAGQQLDVAALLSGRPQPGSPAAGGSPASAGGSATESTRSRFANFFKLEESPAPAAAATASEAAPTAAPDAKPQQLSFGQPTSGGGAAPPPPTNHVALRDAERGPDAPSPARSPAPSGNAGQALLAMLKQQQAAAAAAAGGGGGGARPALPPNAVNSADVTALDEADKVARLTALQGLDDDMLGPAAKGPTNGPPPGMQLPPGAGMPPPHGHLPPGQQLLPGAPPHGMHGFGPAPPGVHPMAHHGHLPPPGAHFLPGQLPPGMHPPPAGMQPPPPGMQFRPPAGMPQYRPPGAGGLAHQPGLPPPQLSQQQQVQQQQQLLAQLLAAQANRGPPPPQQQHMPQAHPGQQINLAALLGAAGAPGMQLPPMPQQALNPAQLQGMRPPPQQGMMPHGMPGPLPGGLPPGINPALLQQLQMQHGLQRPHMPPPMQQHPPQQQQFTNAQLMAALGLAQQGAPQRGMR